MRRCLFLAPLVALACSSGTPAPTTWQPQPAPPPAQPRPTDARPPDAEVAYSGPVTLRALLAELLDQANAGPPTAAALQQHFAPRAKATQNDKVQRGDVFLELEGDLEGLRLWEDGRGWGAYVELAVRKGTLADVEAITGPTNSMPRAPDDFHSGPKVAAYVQRGGHTIRVFAELANQTSDVRRVTVHFQR